MAVTDLEFYGIVTGLADGGPPRLQLLTPSGRVREVPLSRANLVKMIGRAADALDALDREEAKDRERTT